MNSSFSFYYSGFSDNSVCAKPSSFLSFSGSLLPFICRVILREGANGALAPLPPQNLMGYCG